MRKKAEKIVLVGLPGSGKSSVGPLLARLLGWRFVDLDTEIERTAGLSVPEIFAQLGEAEFRRLESELTARLASEADLVLAPGGGWVLHNSLSDAVVVWLQVTPAEAIQRLGVGVVNRPLLQPDPLQRMNELLAERTQHYDKADIQINTNDKAADAVANAIAAALDKGHGT